MARTLRRWMVPLVLAAVATCSCEFVAGIRDIESTDESDGGDPNPGTEAGVEPGQDGADSSTHADAKTSMDGTVATQDGVDARQVAADSPSDVVTDLVTDVVSDVVSDVVTGPEASPDVASPQDSASLPDGCVATGPEICTDGIDNDCNGKTDCADPACAVAGYACVPEWPSGWIAPVALYDNSVTGGPAPEAPPCGGLFPNNLMAANYTPVFSSVTCGCSTCTPSGGTCTGPSVGAFINPGCTNQAGGGDVVAAVGACTEIEGVQGGIQSCEVFSLGTGSDGSCSSTPTETDPTWNSTDAASWAGTGEACGPPAHSYQSGASGGCAAGNYCAEGPLNTFSVGSVCLLSAGQVNCPTSNYTVQHTYYADYADDRGCTASCGCTTPTVTCSPTIEFWTGAGTCDTGTGASTSSVGCVSGINLGAGAGAVSAQVTGGLTVGSCAQTGTSVSNGEGITESGSATTVCCLP